MNILDRFEDSFERLVEGSVGRLFRSPIQPAEIGRKLERAMITNKLVSVGSTFVPNEYRVAMHPDDLVAFESFLPALCVQMEEWLADLADERDFTALEPFHVKIQGDDHVPRRAIQVGTGHVKREAASRPANPKQPRPSVGRTEVFDVIQKPAAAAGIRIRFIDRGQLGAEFVIRKSMTTIGRALDNDIVLDSDQVSRHHARIELVDNTVRVVDLNSTNGTRINGRLVRFGSVRVGDEIMFGTLAAQVLPS